MDNLETALGVLFRRKSVEDIIDERSTCIKCDEFVQLMRCYSDRYSDTELRHLYRTFVLRINESPENTERKHFKDFDVFQLLAEYAAWILTVQDDEIVVPYTRLFHWRNITFELDEDLLSTCFLARKGIEPTTLHGVYAWKSTLTHNNRELHRILNQGLAENHSHLKGAAALFPLTWICLMNMPENYEGVIEKIGDKRRSVNYYYKAGFREKTLNEQIIQAVAIRLLLISFLREGILEEEDREALKNKDYLQNPKIADKEELRRLIGKAKVAPLKAWSDTSEDGGSKSGESDELIIDYASNGIRATENVYTVVKNVNELMESLELCGERWFLYSMFQKILGGASERIENHRHLFYAYLVIKENLRAEFVQINSSVGFENFSIYESRKDLLFEGHPFFEKKQVQNAVIEPLSGSNVVIYEARIAPKDTVEKLKDTIEKLDKKIDPDKRFRNRYYYTIHFIKESDDDYVKLYEENGTVSVQCRHEKLREKCKDKAECIVKLRDSNPDIAQRIRGIDAANMEIGCGPEVFAQTFRYLGSHACKTSKDGFKLPQLRKTYHVGEDYLDMISGLRAIDEALHFLGMSCGDRLGHAMVLGRDVDEWYLSKGKRILLPMGEYLDNLAWMHHALIVHPTRDRVHLEDYIRKEYDYYFHMVYGRYIRNEDIKVILEKARKRYLNSEFGEFYRDTALKFDIESYYAAWKLRGDNPKCYEMGFFDDYFKDEEPYYAFNVNERATKRQAKRYFSNVAMLYYYYHYSIDVRREGSKPVEIIITDEYIECVKFIQTILQKKIATLGICIETNPSSNYKISNLGLYEKHPIFKFYNRHLVDNDEELAACPQLDVSINTDDAGIFATSLENEYAYLALALEKAKGPDGRPKYKRKNIYAWINDVREMGLRQTFLDDASMKIAFQEWNQGGYSGFNPKSSKTNQNTPENKAGKTTSLTDDFT